MRAFWTSGLAMPSIVILTGAGISKESGLDTFRCEGGIWQRVRLEDVATPEGFARNPKRVHAFYNERRRQALDPAVQPNAAHFALARLQQARPGEVLLVTQNIDDLHERGGSSDVVHMHGELFRARCAACGRTVPLREDLSIDNACAGCHGHGTLRPDIVWFGEIPMHMARIEAALGQCKIFLSIGTSGHVYPAAGFVAMARRAGAHTVELNLEPSEGANLFDEHHYGPASAVVPAFIDRRLG